MEISKKTIGLFGSAADMDLNDLRNTRLNYNNKYKSTNETEIVDRLEFSVHFRHRKTSHNMSHKAMYSTSLYNAASSMYGSTATISAM
jgi:hypothetical protein